MISATETNIIIIQKMSKLNRGTLDQSQNGLPIQINETIVNRVNSGHLLFKLKHVMSKLIFTIVYFTGEKIKHQSMLLRYTFLHTYIHGGSQWGSLTVFHHTLSFGTCQNFSMLQMGWNVAPLWLNIGGHINIHGN